MRWKLKKTMMRKNNSSPWKDHQLYELEKKPWVEPTVPEELAEQAAKEGFRLRPKYNSQKVGYVVQDATRKTRACHVEYFLFSTKYGYWYKRSKVKHFHDEYGLSQLGDVVLIAPYRKSSKIKHYRLVEVLKNSTQPVRV